MLHLTITVVTKVARQDGVLDDAAEQLNACKTGCVFISHAHIFSPCWVYASKMELTSPSVLMLEVQKLKECLFVFLSFVNRPVLINWLVIEKKLVANCFDNGISFCHLYGKNVANCLFLLLKCKYLLAIIREDNRFISNHYWQPYFQLSRRLTDDLWYHVIYCVAPVMFARHKHTHMSDSLKALVHTVIVNADWTFLKKSELMARGRTGHSLQTSLQVIWHYTFACMLTLSVGQHTAAPSDSSLKVLFLYITRLWPFLIALPFIANEFYVVCLDLSCLSCIWAAVWNASVHVTLFCHLALIYSVLTNYGFSLTSGTYTSCSASPEHKVHWVWEIISDLLEKNMQLILMLLWTCAAHNILLSHWFILNDYWLVYTINIGMVNSQSCTVKGSKVWISFYF